MMMISLGLLLLRANLVQLVVVAALIFIQNFALLPLDGKTGSDSAERYFVFVSSSSS